MRGNRWAKLSVLLKIGSIPAYAGEPRQPARISGCRGVYPRVCGGTRSEHAVREVANGLSPRMRGNLGGLRKHSPAIGSIPAYAGEPVPVSGVVGDVEVYPRVCGGTLGASAAHWGGSGLSPRMRGNPRRKADIADPPRSIPAYAGEPLTAAALSDFRPVYPRVCGGTYEGASGTRNWNGLSPRMRGNLWRRLAAYKRRGSIPAYAGEPGEGALA